MRKHGLVLKVEDNLRDYLSFDIILLDYHLRAWLGQPHSIAKLEDLFGEEDKILHKTQIPGIPGQNRYKNWMGH